MLCADPATEETRRFLVGPNICEITGVFMTPDERTMFVGIQHPGEAPRFQRPRKPDPLQLLAGRTSGRTTPLSVHRHHQGRRRQDRHLTRFCP